MSKYQRSALIMAFTGLMSLFLVAIVGLSQAPPSGIQLITSPQVGFYPFEAEATTPQLPTLLTLAARNPAGELLANSLFKVQIFTPSSNPFLSTDFPLVEGTKLLELNAIAPEGKVQLQQMLPIRGKYKLAVNVSPIVANQFSPIEQTLTLDVPENPVKYRNYAILVAVLLVVGIGGGWVMGKQSLPQRGEIAPARVRLLLSGAVLVAIASLLVVNVSAEIAPSHDHHSHLEPVETAVSDNSVLQVQISADKHATVGEVANLQVSAIEPKTNQPVKDVIFKLKTTQLENNWVAFAYEGIPDATGKLKWQQQFFDGAPHQLEVEVIPTFTNSKFKPVVATEEIEVDGVAPPLLTRLIGLSYLTGTVIVGLAIGLISRRSTLKRQVSS